MTKLRLTTDEMRAALRTVPGFPSGNATVIDDFLNWLDATIAPNSSDEPKCEHGKCITGNADCAIGTTTTCAKCGEPICAGCGRIRRREPKAPQWDINSIERIARQQGVFGGRDGNTVKITGPISISGPATTRCGSCGQDYDMNAGHNCPEFHAK